MWPAGQLVARKLLKGAVAHNRVAHAYLFRGPDADVLGSWAREFAQVLLCSAPTAEGACGTCRACIECSKGTNPDLFTLGGRGTTIKIRESHDIIRESLTRPYLSKRKVFLIEGARDLTGEAANALLKVLEEPPEYVTFVLTVDNLASLPDTIVSRCEVVPFKAGTPADADSLEPIREQARAMLRASTSSAAVDLAQKYSKLDGDDRRRLIRAAEQELWNLILDSLAKSGPVRPGELKRLWGMWNAVHEAKTRLDNSVNSALALCVMFFDVAQSLRGCEHLLDAGEHDAELEGMQ